MNHDLKKIGSHGGNRKGTGKASQFSQLVHEELKEINGRRSNSLRQLQDMTGISKSRLSVTINKSESPLTINELEAICKAIDVDVADIIATAERRLERDSRQLLDMIL